MAMRTNTNQTTGRFLREWLEKKSKAVINSMRHYNQILKKHISQILNMYPCYNDETILFSDIFKQPQAIKLYNVLAA